jgi:hypothetical protein
MSPRTTVNAAADASTARRGRVYFAGVAAQTPRGSDGGGQGTQVGADYDAARDGPSAGEPARQT